MDSHLSIFHGRGMRTIVFWITVILVVIVDQSAKAAVEVMLASGPKTIVPGVLDLVLVENTGAAFSFGQGAGLLFICAAVIFVAVSVFLVWRSPDMPIPLVITIGLIAGGGVGNMVDRIMKGSVTDFFATTFIDFPVFNVADICITVGIVCSFVGYMMWESRRGQEERVPVATLHDDADSV